jgi:hypothetical protein
LNESATPHKQSVARIGTDSKATFNIAPFASVGSWFYPHTGYAAICNNKNNIPVIPVTGFKVKSSLLVEITYTSCIRSNNWHVEKAKYLMSKNHSILILINIKNLLNNVWRWVIYFWDQRIITEVYIRTSTLLQRLNKK